MRNSASKRVLQSAIMKRSLLLAGVAACFLAAPGVAQGRTVELGRAHQVQVAVDPDEVALAADLHVRTLSEQANAGVNPSAAKSAFP